MTLADVRRIQWQYEWVTIFVLFLVAFTSNYIDSTTTLYSGFLGYSIGHLWSYRGIKKYESYLIVRNPHRPLARRS